MKNFVCVSLAVAAAALVVVRPAVLSSAPDPAVVGQWSNLIAWPHVGVHAHLLPTGEVLTWQYGSTATVWNPQTDIFTPFGNPFTDLLCAGHTFLPDGRLLTLGGWERAGGGIGVVDATTFDPLTRIWTKAQSMAYRRWYPTGTTLPDGRVLVTSGDISRLNDIAAIPEVYNPTANTFTTLPQATNPLPVYPFVFVIPDGRILSAGASEVAIKTQALDPELQGWTTVDPVAADGASAVMYAPGKILKAGTAADSGNTGAAAKTAYVLDAMAPTPAWRATAPMAFARSFMNLTALPDGSVLATGGGTDRSSYNTANAVLEAEVWSPVTETWTTMSAMQAPRLYHSTALLLPDARVLITGGGSDSGVADQLTGQIFSPPYLFKGARPSIATAPATATYGNSFLVATPDATTIASVSLIAAGSVTHAFNATQRFVPLTFQVVDGGLNITAPASGAVAPPGPYLLFIVSAAGVPSSGVFVSVHAAPPPAPVNLTATANATAVNLSWSMPPGAPTVARYVIHRSTTAGFVPSSSTAVGQSATATYADGGLAAATYYYRVVAEDASASASAPSNEATAVVIQQGPPFGVDRTVFSDGLGTRVTPAFSTSAAGELLLAFVGSDGSGTQTVTVSGAGLAWSLVRRVNVRAGTAEIWKAVAPSALSNVTVTAAQATGGFYQSLTVVAVAGAQGTGAVAGNSAATGAPTVSLTTTRDGSLVYAVGNDWDRAVARTPAAGQTIVHQYLASAGDTFWVQATGAVPASGTVVQMSDSAPTTDQWNFAAVEIVPAGPPPVAAPNVVGQTEAAARAAIAAAGLTVGPITNHTSNTVPAGSVVTQTPAAGTPVAPGSAVSLVVSSGPPPPVLVPDVVNQTEANARAAITGAGLVAGTVTPQSSATVPAGIVVSQNPAATTQVSPGSPVDLTVSSGPPPVAVPDVIGQTQLAATAAITDAGLTVGNVTNAPSSSIAAGLVVTETPATGTLVSPGSSVTLVISTGPPSGPAVDKTVFVDGSGTQTTPAFMTTSANELLLAFVASDGPSTGTQTATVSGAGLTWSLVRRVNTQRGTSEIWKATATNVLTNVTVRSVLGTAGYVQSLTVVTFSGASGVGATGAANAATGAPSVSLTTTRAGSLVYAVGNDWDRAIARTPASGQSIVHQYLASTGDTLWVQSYGSPVSAAGTLVRINDTAPTTDRWNFACVEIMP